MRQSVYVTLGVLSHSLELSTQLYGSGSQRTRDLKCVSHQHTDGITTFNRPFRKGEKKGENKCLKV